MIVSGMNRWDYNKREVMYNDLPNLDDSGWKPADPLVIFSIIRNLSKENEKLRELLRDARDEPRHPDYDWHIDFARDVDQALGQG